MRTIFFGTPEIAVPSLRALAETTELVAVVCQPDRPAGRGLELHEPAVKRAAREIGIEVHQPVKVKTGNLDEWLRQRGPDVAVVMAYGRILPPAVLAAPRRGCMNLHASLLPKYRGAAPIQWAVIRGEHETGIALMQMNEGLDTGPVYTERRISILPGETAGELAARLAELAAVVVREDLPKAVSGELAAVPQDDRFATLAPPIEREHARIAWNHEPLEIENFVRGMAPRPGAHTTLRGKLFRILSVRAADSNAEGPPGTVKLIGGGHVLIAAAGGAVELLQAQLEGRRALGACDLVNGRVLRDGDLLGA